ncbi:hypothetical protein WJX81_000523 [Elliptochloris bilobata]|uniref:3,4-dihydroxy-2-butanone-4-phosphate synthase n=1 Tax=Elliptochloris bilobata TaxID=381761 RepID=A0AAW1QJU7_9CHLO
MSGSGVLDCKQTALLASNTKLLRLLTTLQRRYSADWTGQAQMTTEAMAFFVEHTSGVVCVAMEGDTLDRLALPLMVASRENEEALYTAFTVTVDARHGISTGISALDRALTRQSGGTALLALVVRKDQAAHIKHVDMEGRS